MANVKYVVEECKNDKVQTYGQNASIFLFHSGTKNNNTSSHILLDHSHAFGLSFYAAGLKKKFLKDGAPLEHILPRPGSTP